MFSSQIFISFFASLVECVEALTIVLAVGISRGWTASLTGVFASLFTLAVIILGFGSLLKEIDFPLGWLQFAIGVLLLVFGLRWLRKAVLRAAGRLALHDEARIFSEHIQLWGQDKILRKTFDYVAALASFKAVLLEGMEIVFIILALGTPSKSFAPATIGAALALVIVIILGLLLHKPLTHIPENTLKLSVGIILTAFGIFWLGEGSGYHWPLGEGAILAMALLIWSLASLSISYLRDKKTS